MKAVNIEWDVSPDDYDYRLALPNEVEIPTGLVDLEDISEYISDNVGYCHKGFAIEE